MMRNDGVMQLIVQGLDRFALSNGKKRAPYITAKIEVLPDLVRLDEEEIEALKRNIQGMVQEALALLPNVPPEIRMAVITQQDPIQLSYFMARCLTLGRDRAKNA
jgi:Lon protease-like protein